MTWRNPVIPSMVMVVSMAGAITAGSIAFLGSDPKINFAGHVLLLILNGLWWYAVSYSGVPIHLQKVAEEYGATVTRDPFSGPNYASVVIGRQHIRLGPFTDPEEELAAFFHEIGHLELESLLKAAGRNQYTSVLAKEGAAWELGFCIARRHGYVWGYHSKAYAFARKCLATYTESV